MIPSWYRRELTLGDSGGDVKIVRRKLGLDPEGDFDRVTAERVRGLARKRKVDSEGEVNEAVATELGETERRKAGLNPTWYTRRLELWFEGDDVRTLRNLLGLRGNDNRYDPDAEAAVRRFQSNHGIKPSGIVDEETAVALGEK